MEGRRLGLFGRGGSGKSTCVVLLARVLADRGYPVWVVDADSTNEGLPQALGADRPSMSLLDWLGGTVFSGGTVTCPVDDPTPLAAARVKIEELPAAVARRTPEGIRVLQTGKMGPLGPGAGCDGPMTKIARDFQVHGGGGLEPVVLLDFKAGIEDVSRGVITALDWAVVVVDPTHAAIEAAWTMQELVTRIQAGELPATRHLETPALVRMAEGFYRDSRLRGVRYVLNKVSDATLEGILRDRLARAGIEAVAILPEDPEIRHAWLEGTRVSSPAAERALEQLVQVLEEAEAALVASR